MIVAQKMDFSDILHSNAVFRGDFVSRGRRNRRLKTECMPHILHPGCGRCGYTEIGMSQPTLPTQLYIPTMMPVNEKAE